MHIKLQSIVVFSRWPRHVSALYSVLLRENGHADTNVSESFISYLDCASVCAACVKVGLTDTTFTLSQFMQKSASVCTALCSCAKLLAHVQIMPQNVAQSVICYMSEREKKDVFLFICRDREAERHRFVFIHNPQG